MTDFDCPSHQEVISPTALAHVVLRTKNLAAMRDFYVTFLGARISHGNDFVCFLYYDEEHHRIAIVQIDQTVPKNVTSCGLEHVAFAFPDLSTLLLSYRQRLQRGIKPVWNVNHGPTNSIYYKDPDGNLIETQVDNFQSADEVKKYMAGPEFAENPIGTDFDPEDYIRRLQAGAAESSFRKRQEIGPRGLVSAESFEGITSM
ncbi:hypothetical protein M409DRAFT_57676 [Zasmidium cellare ATCC 36951]|uniref:VOC domain-containing protein n=1 Tax=Zasmidium cellare ATCC 36951 TaxID=1080233 RepID=A0A6A6C9S7_ZASCE|nr:uncharacterized protein M409DRAFT_57676 [Zasmidium cellare ATCC 36951]KAF2162990.1 hypothetical protein M409DRAFT_57676 [Zasmidium cellare ATCC 36951]